MFKAFIKEPLKTCYEGEDKDEKILYVMRASILTMVPWALKVALAAIFPMFFGPFLLTFKFNNQLLVDPAFVSALSFFWYIFTFGIFLQGLVNWFFNVYIITNKKILDMDFFGLLYKNISETTLENVQDVTSTIRGTFGTIFNIGNVFIQTAGEKTEFEFTNVDNPSKIRDLVADLISQERHHAIK